MSPFPYYLAVTVLLFLLGILCDSPVSGYRPIDESKDLVISYNEKQALDKLKAQIMDILPEDFMKSDFYLLRWIRMADMDINEARSMLMKNLQWRAKNNMSHILEEHWEDLRQEYHTSFGAKDKEGRPVGTIDMGEWDLLKAVLAGKGPRLQRYLRYTTERGIRELFKAQAHQEPGTKPVTRGMILVDGEGGNIRNLCPACIAILFQWIREMELYYPKFIREITIINAPSVTEMALRALRPAMSQETSDAIHIFTMNKRIWMEYLDKHIDRSQRSPRYGGTRKE